MAEKVPYYKVSYNRVDIFPGRAGFPRIAFWINGYGKVWVGNILLGTKEKRQWFWDNQEELTRWIDIADMLEECKTHEERIAVLEGGSIWFGGEPVSIKEKK